MEFRPFLKWAGGKTQLLPLLAPRTSPGRGTYYEPFLGGGALFFAIASGVAPRLPEGSKLNELNRGLMTTFAAVRDSPDRVIEQLRARAETYLAASQKGRNTYFYEVRGESLHEGVSIAARLIFLNKTCYNGLYRENRRGTFNVPHGSYVSPNILDQDAIWAASRALRGVVLQTGDFERSCEFAEEGDFVYLDPPFHPLSRTSSFTTYTRRDFDAQDQRRLRRVVGDLTDRGVDVMLSNSAHPWIRELYGDDPRFVMEALPARRVINSRGDRRGVIDELVITNYDPAPQSTK